MSVIRVQRTSLGPIATTGILTMDHMGFRLYTLEDAWKDNRNGISCVPAGTYTLERHDSQKYGKIWAMVNPGLDVYHWPGDRPNGKGRFACLCAHSGNEDEHVEGCIIIGLRAGIGYDESTQRDEPMVWDSRLAVKKFQRALAWEDHELIITNP